VPKEALKPDQATRTVDLLERLGAIALYLHTDMDHHSIARRLGMGTQRVTAILKGLKKSTVTKNG
jgi:DNA-binding transcriptional regulator LsrR (DeoR family)